MKTERRLFTYTQNNPPPLGSFLGAFFMPAYKPLPRIQTPPRISAAPQERKTGPPWNRLFLYRFRMSLSAPLYGVLRSWYGNILWRIYNGVAGLWWPLVGARRRLYISGPQHSGSTIMIRPALWKCENWRKTGLFLSVRFRQNLGPDPYTSKVVKP